MKGLCTYSLCISSLPNVQCLNLERFKLSNFSEIFQPKQLQVFCQRTATRHPEFTCEVYGFHERFRYLSFIYLQLTKCPVPDDPQDEVPTVPTVPRESQGTANQAPASGECDKDGEREDILKILDDAIANSPNPDHREDVETDSGTENQGVKSVVPSDSEQDKITVNPNIIEEPNTVEESAQSETEQVEVADDPSPAEESREESPKTDTLNNVPAEADDAAPENNNNNKKRDLVTKIMSTHRHRSTHPPNQQLILNGVPVAFPGNLMEQSEALRFIYRALTSYINELSTEAVIDIALLNPVNSSQGRASVVITFDTIQTRDRVLREGNEYVARFPNSKRYYFNEIPRRSGSRTREKDREDELDERRTKLTDKVCAKEDQKAKNVSAKAADKVRTKYKQLKTGTPTAVVRPQEADMTRLTSQATSTPITEANRENQLERLNSQVLEMLAMFRHSKTNVRQTELSGSEPLPGQEEAGFNDTTIPYQEDGREEALNQVEAQLRENALVSQIEARNKRIAKSSTAAKNDGDLRDTLRGNQGPSDLRNAILNQKQDVRQQMRPRAESSDLRNTHLIPIRDRRERTTSPLKFGTLANFYNPTPITATDNTVRQLAKRAADLDMKSKLREKVMDRLRASVRGTDQQRDESSDEGEAEHSETSEEGVEPGSALEDELTGVVYSENENTGSNQKPGPSGRRKACTPVRANRETTSEATISPIKFPTAQSTPRRSRSAARRDLREKLNSAPVSAKPKLISNKRPMSARLGKTKPYPWSVWLPGCTPMDPANPEDYDDGEDDEEIGRVTEDDVTTDEMEEEDFTNKNQNKEQE